MELQDRLLDLLIKHKKGLGHKEMARKLSLSKRQKSELQPTLQRLLLERRLERKDNRYKLQDRSRLIAATIVKVAPTFGFAAPVSGGNDYFIPGRLLRGAMPGDAVLLAPKPGSGQLSEAEVFEITAQQNPEFSGVVVISDSGKLAVLPDRYLKQPMPIAAGLDNGARPGESVMAILESRGERHSEHTVRVVESLGSNPTAAACARSILRENGIPTEFSPEALEQATGISAAGIHEKEILVRKDLRDELIFTIDGADTKDIDDAISLSRHENGWTLGVHIADVSYYVTSDSALDKDAFARGTSVYYADQVVPMLPKELSNGICSLNPGVDRLALSATIELDNAAKIIGYRFKKTVIRSRIQGVYSEVNTILNNTATPEVLAKYDGLAPTLLEMNELSKQLFVNRRGRGSVNLETSEGKIILGEDGLARDVQVRERGESEKMIEEFMLTANEAAASLAMTEKLPFVYRTHEAPSPEKLAGWYLTLERLGIPFTRSRKISPASVSAVLEAAKATPHYSLVNSITLRVMQKARYSPQNTGHFGLALDNYSQFTSPIRRYPDLAIHRVLSGLLTGMRRDNIEKRYREWVVPCAVQSSARELAAMTAERDCEDCYKAEYMRGHIGESFNGTISGVMGFGVFVALDNTVEGLVPLEELPQGEWAFDETGAFNGRHGERLAVGDRLTVRVTATDVVMGTVNFSARGEATE